jgi:hypothetical protein
LFGIHKCGRRRDGGSRFISRGAAIKSALRSVSAHAAIRVWWDSRRLTHQLRDESQCTAKIAAAHQKLAFKQKNPRNNCRAKQNARLLKNRAFFQKSV